MAPKALFRITLATVTLGALGLVAYSFFQRPELTLHYRQTVVLDGPSGPVEMSGVFKEVARYSGPIAFVGVSAHMKSYRHGEALGIDVPGVGYVVQSLNRRLSGPIGTVVSMACGLPPPDVSSAWSARFWLWAVDEAFKDKCELPVSASQLVVIFPDSERPELGTAYFPDHLPEGLHIKSILLERTTDAVTYGQLPTWMWSFQRSRSVPVLPLIPDDGSVFTLSENYFVDGVPDASVPPSD